MAFSLGMDDGTLRYQGRLCVPNIDGLRERIMIEGHTSRYFVHLGFTKMHHDLKEVYRWNGMKRNVADFCGKMSELSASKGETPMARWVGTEHRNSNMEGSWDDHLPLIEFAYNNIYHACIQMPPFEALYGRRCRSPIGWFEIGEAELVGPDLVHQAMERVKIIKERLKTAQSR
ncbi:PREDICTED: uncharacterized protein LOC109227684 [Nicotiana attenuata]|uniref:uncharacterized protein LOC109227684 n=1 Tax=Nicotiana attenuata TaxID=49451 RepID=UPI000904C04D|nr:PREDICTED: uncharacterized protein LOC109227684 [Nicotiana attenuata]